MLPMYVALVPYEEGLVRTNDLLKVAAALQTQVSRDLGPLWGVSGVVAPFLSLDNVPPGYAPLAIVKTIPEPAHFFNGGPPIALVSLCGNWSVSASHELLEMICDPSGDRTMTQCSLERCQGLVEFLVEVCDPCQTKSYSIDTICVSDFVTPQYFYAPEGTEGLRCSFTESIKGPRELADGGLISWSTPDGEIWQKPANGDPCRLTGSSPRLTRAWVNPLGRKSHLMADFALSPDEPRDQPDPAPQRGHGYGQVLRDDIDRILVRLGVRPPTDLRAMLKLFRQFAEEGSHERASYERDAEQTLRDAGIQQPSNFKPLPNKLPPPSYFQELVSTLEQGRKLGDPTLADWMATHGALFPAGL